MLKFIVTAKKANGALHEEVMEARNGRCKAERSSCLTATVQGIW